MQTKNRYWMAFGSLFALILALWTSAVQVEASGVEEGAIQQHDLFEFVAFINHNDIVDGTEPFDSNNNAGNDKDKHNKIVRSWDTVSYPVKITVNPKKADMLENIKLRLTGTLKNGVTGDRINAKFAVGGKESIDKGEVSFVQEYTISRTGNSIMIPVTIEVLGAKHGVKLTPDIQVQVMSVDGQDISKDKVITVFDELPGVTTSAKVSIRGYTGDPLSSSGLPYYPLQAITGDEDEMQNIHGFHVAWGIQKLPGKTDNRGATFPDSTDTINYSIDLTGDVYWDAGPNKGKRESLNFNGRDTPFMLFDHQPVTTATTRVGAEHMLTDGISYYFRYAKQYTTPYSALAKPYENRSQLDKQRSVWDSGTWEVSKPSQSKHAVSYKGTNTDFVIGSTFPIYYGYATTKPYFGVNDKIFSTHGFLVKMPNEYYAGGPNNPKNYRNDVNYRATVTLEGYTDKNGRYHKFDTQQKLTRTFTERNRYIGGPYILNDFVSHPGKKVLGTPVIGMGSISKGDASTLIGEDVYFRSRLVNPHYYLYGGFQGVYRWNTDSFELTEPYAEAAEKSVYSAGYPSLTLDRIRNNKETQDVMYGVPKFTDNSFQSFTKKGIDDYTWYDTYKEAIKHGPVGAIQNHVDAPVGSGKLVNPEIPLRVKHENIGIGAESKDGTANIAVTNFYIYMDKDRKQRIDVTDGRTYGNPALWDSDGNILEKQRPSGSGANFETLAVVPAETSIATESDKASYYNSDTIKWTTKNSIALPESGVPDELDAGITVKHTLPAGLDYKTGTGKIGNNQTEPEITNHSNGTKTLTWSLLVSNQNHTIPTITFQTTINPFALNTNGVQSSVEIKSVIESDLDRRPENLRTSTKSVTILKVGMVGIYESIDKLHGDKNSDFTLTLSPYTTIEDEQGVTGLTVIPLSGDDLGSKYSGSAKIKAINLTADREHDDQDVKIYLNRQLIDSDRPHEIDVRRGGWYEYTGSASQLDGAVSLLFHVEGKMTNRDNIKIDVSIQTANNEFGDVYLNETVINSDTNYRLSPVSNRVRYTIRADLELKLERFQIYTDKASKGLPTSVRVGQVVLDEPSVKNETITLAIYDTDSGDKVTEKTYKQSELRSENKIKIPASVLDRGTVKNYEVRIEGYNTNKIWVRDGEGSLDTDGHTAKEQTLTLDDANNNGNIVFKDVVMTERELGAEMQEYHESLTVHQIDEPTVKSGYGYGLNAKVEYTNDLMNDVQNNISDVVFTTDVNAAVHHKLMDKSLEFYDENAGYTGDAKVVVPLVRTDAPSTNKTVATYKLPQIFLEEGTGLTYTLNQKENGEIDGNVVDAGHKLYVPVWLDSVGDYGVVFTNETPMGSHFMNFEIPRNVHVDAYMFHHTDSETPDKDELLIHPMEQSDIPENW